MRFVIIFIILSLPLELKAEECKWSNIKQEIRSDEPVFVYDKFCHHKVGVLVGNEKDYQLLTNSLKKTIELKDLQISETNKKAILWEEETKRQRIIFEEYRKAENMNRWLFFGGGVLATALSVYLAGQLAR